MPKLIIDDKEITVDPGTTVIAAAHKLGVEVPHYCYHPGLSIAGACRMCLVEIEKLPKLQTACSTVATEGMVVRSMAKSERVRAAVRGVLELTLINHPLDCPVCDQSGECGLQDYYMRYGQYDSRFLENKVKKAKKAVPIGPYVVLDQERCILCSRCIRFCREITKTDELGIFNRGDHSIVDIYPGKELNNKYSGNVIDICPVGALTDRDFRFQVRVWYLEETDSICPGCSNGCNIKIHYNVRRRQHGGGRRVFRLKPRFNGDVNKWWMCDEGRYNYRFVDENRIQHPQERSRSSNGQSLTRVDWKAALNKIATALKDTIAQHGSEAIGVIASPQLTNEELYLIKKLFKQTLQIKNIDFKIPPPPDASHDDFLIKADKNPNTRGAEALDLSPGFDDGLTIEGMLDAAAEGKLKVLYVFGHDLAGRYGEGRVKDASANVSLFVYQGSNFNPTTDYANVLLPSATYAEKNGTFTNFAGRVQRINKALEPLNLSAPDWLIVTRLAQTLGIDFNYRHEEEIFNELSRQEPAFAEMTYAKIGSSGLVLNQG